MMQKRMKLVFLSHESTCTGGAQKCLLDLIKGIKQIHSDWQIFLIFPNQGDLVKACQPYVTDYLIVKMKWWLMDESKARSPKKKITYWMHCLKACWKIRHFLQSIQPDHTISNTLALPHLAITSRWLGIRHTWFLHEVPENTWHHIALLLGTEKTLKLVNRLSERVLVPSDYAYRYYQGHIKESKLHTILQAVELPPATQILQRHPEYSVLLVGSFDSNKGQLELLQAIHLIQQSHRNIHVYLTGPDNGGMKPCKQYIQENQMDQLVEILPFTSDITSLYQRTDVVAVCSLVETFGRVAIEAQLCGLPVILANTSANPERIINGVNGLLYEKGNAKDLADKIEQLRPEKVRQCMRQKLNAAELSATFSQTAFARRFCTLLMA